MSHETFRTLTMIIFHYQKNAWILIYKIIAIIKFRF